MYGYYGYASGNASELNPSRCGGTRDLPSNYAPNASTALDHCALADYQTPLEASSGGAGDPMAPPAREKRKSSEVGLERACSGGDKRRFTGVSVTEGCLYEANLQAAYQQLHQYGGGMGHGTNRTHQTS